MAYEEGTLPAYQTDVLAVRNWLLEKKFTKAAAALGEMQGELAQHICQAAFNVYHDSQKPGRGKPMTVMQEKRIRLGLNHEMLATALRTRLLQIFPNGHPGRALKPDAALLARIEREAPESLTNEHLQVALTKYFELDWKRLMAIHGSKK